MDKVKYGIFPLGQAWRLVSAGRDEAAFESREEAVNAARAIMAAHAARGQPAVVIMPDVSGRIVTVEAR